MLGPGGQEGCHPGRLCCVAGTGSTKAQRSEGRECPRKGEQPSLGVIRKGGESGRRVVQM